MSIAATRLVDPTTLPSAWRQEGLLGYDHVDVGERSMKLGPLKVSKEQWFSRSTMEGFSLTKGQLAHHTPDGSEKVIGTTFVPVVKLDATSLQDAVAGAEQFAKDITQGDTLPGYVQHVGETSSKLSEGTNWFGEKYGRSRPMVGVLHDAAQGSYYAAAFEEMGLGRRDSHPLNPFKNRSTSTYSFTALQDAVKAVVHMGEATETPVVGEPAAKMITRG
jgi:hypothetical protein